MIAMMWITKMQQRFNFLIQRVACSASTSNKTKRPQYSLKDLLAECDETAPYPSELKDFEKAPRTGQELF